MRLKPIPNRQRSFGGRLIHSDMPHRGGVLRMPAFWGESDLTARPATVVVR
jgi:hypothetical protein